MTVKGTNYLSLMDWARRKDPNGKLAAIVEILDQSHPMIKDMPFKEGNLPTGHMSTIRTGLPTVYWRQYNEGTQLSKSTTAQITDNCGMMDAWAEVDADLVKLEVNPDEFRASEASAFLEAMTQEAASTLIYGNNGVNPKEFTGLALRYSTLSSSDPISSNVINGGATTGSCTSIYLIGWGDKIFGTFPKGSTAGLEHQNLGEVTVTGTDASGNTTRMRALQDHFTWKLGLVVRDWRFAARGCNISVANLKAKSSAADLREMMVKMLAQIPNKSTVNLRFYMSRSTKTCLEIQRYDNVSTGGGLTFSNVDGEEKAAFQGVPIEQEDAVLETESAIAA